MPLVVPVRNSAARTDRVQSFSGVSPPPGTMTWTAFDIQLGRTLALAGDKVKAKLAYGNFLTLWKDADSDIPVLVQAKAENARLQ